MEQICDCGNVKSGFESYCYVCTFKTDYVTKDYVSENECSEISESVEHTYPEAMSVGWSEISDTDNNSNDDSLSEDDSNQPSDISLPYNYGNNWVLERPEVFVGSVNNHSKTRRLFNTEYFYFKPIEYNEAAENIFKNVLEFACDTAMRIKNNSGQIKVYFTPTTVTFKFKPDENINLEMFEYFNQIEEGTYQNQDIINANIFSESFKVEIFHNHHNYYQSWSDNMKYSSGPERYYISGDRKDMVYIEYRLDSSIFGHEIYTNDMIELLSCHVADVALTYKIPIKIVDQVNDNKVSWGEVDMYTYASYYHVKNPDIVYYNSDNSDNSTKTTELVISFVRKGGYHVSFVNGIYTEDGGAHVGAVYKEIKKQLRENGIDVSMNYLKDNIEIFMSCWVKNPCFNNQVKSSFHSPVPKFDFEIKPLLKFFDNHGHNDHDTNGSYCIIS